MGSAHPSGRQYTVCSGQRLGDSSRERRDAARRASRHSPATRPAWTPQRRRRHSLHVICEEALGAAGAAGATHRRQIIPRARLSRTSSGEDDRFLTYTHQYASRPSIAPVTNNQGNSDADDFHDVSLCDEVFPEVPPGFRDDSEVCSVASGLTDAGGRGGTRGDAVPGVCRRPAEPALDAAARRRRRAEQLTKALKAITDGGNCHGLTDSDQERMSEGDPSPRKLAEHKRQGTFSKRSLISFKTDAGSPEMGKDAHWKGIVAKKSTERKKFSRSSISSLETSKHLENVQERRSSILKLTVAADNLYNRFQQSSGVSLECNINGSSDQELGSKTKRQKSAVCDKPSCFIQSCTTKVQNRPESTYKDTCHSRKVRGSGTATCKSCVLTGQTDDDKLRRNKVFCNESLTKYKNSSTCKLSNFHLNKASALSPNECLSADGSGNKTLCHINQDDPLIDNGRNSFVSEQISKDNKGSENLPTVDVDTSDLQQLIKNHSSCSESKISSKEPHNPYLQENINPTNYSKLQTHCKSSTVKKDSNSKNEIVKTKGEEKNGFETMSEKNCHKKPKVFEKFSTHKKDEGFCGLLQYLHENKRGLSEILARNNVIIEPLQEGSTSTQEAPIKSADSSLVPKTDESDKSCRITGATVKYAARNTEKAVSGSTNSLPKQHSQRPVLRRHFFYNPTRTNRELVDEELPEPDKVKITRQLFENSTAATDPFVQDGGGHQDKMNGPSSVSGYVVLQSGGKSGRNCRAPNSCFGGKGQTRVENCSESLEDLSSCADVKQSCVSLDGSMSAQNNPEAKMEERRSSVVDQEDLEEGVRYVTPEVLEKIRACGTSVTYYGGHIISRSRGSLTSPMTTAIMDEIRQGGDSDGPGFVLKFRLVKSNSCGSRIELAGADEAERSAREQKSNPGMLQEGSSSCPKAVEPPPKTEALSAAKNRTSPLCVNSLDNAGNTDTIPNNRYESQTFKLPGDNFSTSDCQESHHMQNTSKSHTSKTFIEGFGRAKTYVDLINKPVIKNYTFNDMEFEEFEVLDGNIVIKSHATNEVENQNTMDNVASPTPAEKTNLDVEKSSDIQLSEDFETNRSIKDNCKGSGHVVPMTTWANHKYASTAITH
ncbi:uncharacterized protein LOC134541437 [Bacillus rossius redtenbacheri]|uniref:uncharacterized protein LOC134541437 n=1 Tax=Bacillus rossius redtenbacheri TaxID=93214 RepID=UPI002FDDF17A